MEHVNPFSLVRASDYTDEQINSLWVELGPNAIDRTIEPMSRISKFILGGKGTGKTHILRYHSYHVARLRHPEESGLSTVTRLQFLALFLRATNVDSRRFESNDAQASRAQWQQLFGIYLELRLVEGLLDALCDIKRTSPQEQFNDAALISEIAKTITDFSIDKILTVSELYEWVLQERRRVDDAVNNAAFSGSLNVRIPFAIGSLCLPIGRALGKWNQSLIGIPLLYLIDEIENFSEPQQQVVNSLIRYGEGSATFRVTGRLYAKKTNSTLSDGEENREGSEFKTTYLDEILRKYHRYPTFARNFVLKRLSSSNLHLPGNVGNPPDSFFDTISSGNYYSSAIDKLELDSNAPEFIDSFSGILATTNMNDSERHAVIQCLTQGMPLLLQKLNILRFCKKARKGAEYLSLAQSTHNEAVAFIDGDTKSAYGTAYSHWAADLFAQLCRESKKAKAAPYAGFDTFINMSSGNPRNLLIVLGKAYEIATFKGINFPGDEKLAISLQTDAAEEAARFLFESDSNYGGGADLARKAVERLASLLRTARFALNIPEVSPLAVSFSSSDLTPSATLALNNALNYSFVFEVVTGRPDRNSQQINRKIQLNPLLSPRWSLPVARRGDIPLSGELLNSIFDENQAEAFRHQLRQMKDRWNNPFKRDRTRVTQKELF